MSNAADHLPARLVTVGLVASPGPAAEIADALVAGLTDRIGAYLPDARWEVRQVRDRLVHPPAELSQLISAARQRLLAEGWDLAALTGSA
jgi:hypothetical protein